VYHLQDTLNLLPDLDEGAITRAFTTNTNDQLLVVYLSALVRAVIALEKLVDNKATNGVAELEDGSAAGPPGKKGNKNGKVITDVTAKDDKSAGGADRPDKPAEK
jgi:26S proteasome regulatory subunit N8